MRYLLAIFVPLFILKIGCAPPDIYTPPNFIRHVYTNSLTPSNGSLTESFIRSRASLSPSYFYNEIVTRYNMISVIPKDLTHLKKSVEKYA